jgi:Zn finger protein HypA/HybF involved in hydrogenase expression
MLFDLHVRLVDPLVAPALLAPFLFWNTATAEEGNSFLADRHVSRGVQCQSCHTESGKLKEYKEFGICSSCQGDYDTVIKKTAGKFKDADPNPHDQHDGNLPCTECHHGHSASKNYCADCHSYTYNVP